MLRLLWLVPALTGASAARSESPVGLDLDAIESRLRVETVAVERASFASVAAVNLYVLIGVSRSQMPQAGPGDVVIYLCDNDQMGLSFTGPWPEETTHLRIRRCYRNPYSSSAVGATGLPFVGPQMPRGRQAAPGRMNCRKTVAKYPHTTRQGSRPLRQRGRMSAFRSKRVRPANLMHGTFRALT